MTHESQPTSSAAATIATPDDARKLSNGLMEVMTTLLEVIETETTLVRAGKVREAMALEPRKTELSRAYLTAISQLTTSQNYFADSAPDLLEALHRHHDVFRAMLQVNLTVLATAHAVSEGVIRGVNGEMQKKNTPQTYTSAGKRSAPNTRRAEPLTVSRTL
ncbi:hypothetical protein [Bradyrhizobium prioriisuperbiae]|uniref:hypothetical protein n=1 Tax=Bradyrhizobium prioriisuperbiae TaxID=2854389 RepID=UPI0028E9DCF8|nr:hypothetical protein [Bradyrhizobium prioritasuperba]